MAFRECEPNECRVEVAASSVRVDRGEGTPLSRMRPQERAIRAIRHGLRLRAPGTNIVIIGPRGTGRTFLATALAREEAGKRATPDDVVLLPNPHGPLEPIPARLPAGTAPALVRAMETLHARLTAALHQVLEGDERNRIVLEIQQRESTRRNELRRKVDRLAASYGLSVVETDQGIELVPAREPTEEPDRTAMVPDAQLELPGLADPHGTPTMDQRRYLHAVEALRPHVEAMERALALVEAQATAQLASRQRKALRTYVDAAFRGIPKDVLNTEQLRAHVRRIFSHIVEHFRLQEDDTLPIPSDPIEAGMIVPTILTSSNGDGGAPLVHARNPTLARMFGRMVTAPEETRYPPPGTILAGDLHQANGGFLLVDAESLLAHPRVYEHLKSCLLAGKILPLEEGDGQFLRPRPVDLDVKVLLIADPALLARLVDLDPEFGHLFKIRAEFAPDMPLADALSVYPEFCAWLSAHRGLPPCRPDAVAELVSHGARLADHRTRATAELGRLENVMLEAAAVAGETGSAIDARHVREAIGRMRDRDGRIFEEILESHVRGRYRCQVAGKAIGQVNGLGVVSNGFVRAGRPLRVTAVTYAGEEGTVAIDREVELSGPIHDKGVLVLTGFLSSIFADRQALGFCASVVFEQNYDVIDGDSASVAELVAILSSLGGVPVRQDVAVTGSIDQLGWLLAVGGIAEKVEGFFDVCRALGPLDSQGVIVPAANADQLVLRPDVVAALEAGTFHVYTADRIEDVVELLLEIPAGFPRRDGSKTPRMDRRTTLYKRVCARLLALREGTPPPRPRPVSPRTRAAKAAAKSRAKR